MPHVEEVRHKGKRRSSPPTYCTWKGVHPNVLGSIVVRLSELGYGVLFGTTSDGGRLTLSAYMGEVRRTAYFKHDVTPVEIFRELQKVLNLPSRLASPPAAPPTPPPAPPKAPAAISTIPMNERVLQQARLTLDLIDRGIREEKRPGERAHLDALLKGDTII